MGRPKFDFHAAKDSIFVSRNSKTFSKGDGAPRESKTLDAASSSLSSSDITEFILFIVPPPACRGAGKAPTNALKTCVEINQCVGARRRRADGVEAENAP